MKKVALEWLGSCSGCEISFLNMGDFLLSCFEKIEIVHAPLLMDNKYVSSGGHDEELNIPEADIGFVSGGVANEDHLVVLRKMREKCSFLVALGTCASHGGIPALMNGEDPESRLLHIFETTSTDKNSGVPNVEVPPFLDRVYALDEQVQVDLVIPGCAPNPELIQTFLEDYLEGREVHLPTRSVCDSCPVIRKGKGEVSEVKRFVVNADYKADQPLSQMQCLLEQGFLCMGPVTLDGCSREGAPACIQARVPCRGCYGPVKKNGNQMLDMMNGLTSNGINYKSVIDRRSLLRFSGAHGRLRVVKKRS